MSLLPSGAARRCQNFLNSLHSTVYFAERLEKDLANLGIGDPTAAYLAGRAAPLGPAGPGLVTSTFYTFNYHLVARHLPAVWGLTTPRAVLDLRLRAVQETWRRFLPPSPGLVRAADLALRAAQAGIRAGRPLYAAHADLPVPDDPGPRLWHAATLLREHRGDTHFAVLAAAGLDGVEALVTHAAGRTGMPTRMGEGMPKAVALARCGWSEPEWSAAADRLRARGLLDGDGALTPAGRRLRAELDDETDRLDQAPYERIGAAGVAELTALCERFANAAARAGAYPAELVAFFTTG
jgi:hypothetical protein